MTNNLQCCFTSCNSSAVSISFICLSSYWRTQTKFSCFAVLFFSPSRGAKDSIQQSVCETEKRIKVGLYEVTVHRTITEATLALSTFTWVFFLFFHLKPVFVSLDRASWNNFFLKQLHCVPMLDRKLRFSVFTISLTYGTLASVTSSP